MKYVLLDTNVLLDIALKRLPHFEKATEIFRLIDKRIIKGHVTASTITDIYYISKKEKGHEKALEFISNLIEVVDIIGVDRAVIVEAIKSGMSDFEDAIQSSAAEFNGIRLLITRNKEDFSRSKMKVFTPEEFLDNHP